MNGSCELNLIYGVVYNVRASLSILYCITLRRKVRLIKSWHLCCLVRRRSLKICGMSDVGLPRSLIILLAKRIVKRLILDWNQICFKAALFLFID